MIKQDQKREDRPQRDDFDAIKQAGRPGASPDEVGKTLIELHNASVPERISLNDSQATTATQERGGYKGRG